jgi:hypothetical protein
MNSIERIGQIGSKSVDSPSDLDRTRRKGRITVQMRFQQLNAPPPSEPGLQ